MEKVLFLASVESDGSLSRGSLETLSAAADVAASLPDSALVVGLIGDDVQAAADAVAACGAEKILGVSGADFGVSRYATDAAAAAALIQASEASVVVAPQCQRLARALPGVAQRLEGRIDTQVTGLSCDGGQLHIQRWYYRQRMVAHLRREQRPWLLLIASGVYGAWSGDAGSAAVEAVTPQLGDGERRTQVKGMQAATADAQTIRPDADILFVAGAGWTKKQADGAAHTKEAEELILGILEKASASLGSSKSLVEQSGEGQDVLPFMSHMNQVGQTGATPRHPKGLATCCHGEEPHVVGWRFINDRRAVNLDANCGWAHGKADVLYVADAFEVLAALNAIL
ncbi:electron transfer flavoprotein subunit alpha/FixB family protein [Candidatus Latescibacterota bacterium]